MRPHTRGSIPEPSSKAPCPRDNAGPVAGVNIAVEGQTPGMRGRRLALAERFSRWWELGWIHKEGSINPAATWMLNVREE